MIIRICSICREEKLLSNENFHRDKSRNSGFGYNCRLCEKKRSHKKYLNNPRLGRYKLMTEQQKKHKLQIEKKYFRTPKGRAISLLKAYKRHDTKKNRSNDLTQNFLIEIFTKTCIYCGLNDEPIGCERIDNSKGHLTDNVVPCCRTCNLARGDHFTFEEMKILGKNIREIKLSRNKSAILKVI